MQIYTIYNSYTLTSGMNCIIENKKQHETELKLCININREQYKKQG